MHVAKLPTLLFLVPKYCSYLLQSYRLSCRVDQVTDSTPGSGEGIVMARTTPRVDGSSLVDGGDGGEPITIGTVAWYAWLDQATSFAVATTDGIFSAGTASSARSGLSRHASRLRDATRE